MIGIVFPWQWSLGPKSRSVLRYAWLYAYTLLLYASSRGGIDPNYRLKDTDDDYRLKDTDDDYQLKDTDGIVWYVIW